MAGKRKYNEFGPDYHDEYLKALDKGQGLYSVAAEAVGCHPNEVAAYRKENSEFADECRAVEQKVRDRVVSEVFRRGMEGIDKAVIGGRDRNEIVHIEKHYSDQLLLALAKRCPDGSFTERQEITHKGEVGLRAEMDYSKLSPRARKMLRDLLQVIVEDEKAQNGGGDAP